MKNVGFLITVPILVWQLCTVYACKNKNHKVTEKIPLTTGVAKKNRPKPPSTYPDTLLINFPAAVFYHPDSLQLIKIKAQTDPMVFDGSMHEFFYQMRNARMVIKKNWPKLKIVEAMNYRHLFFVTADNTRYYIDLDDKNDVHGLFVFNRHKMPISVDMMNIETEFSFYLKE